MMQIVAVSVGAIAPLFTAQQEVRSAIRNSPVSTLENARAVAVGALGIEGDEQADRSVHGGPSMAVYLYPHEHYPVWQTIRHQALKVDEALPFGFMGENLTIVGLLESEVYVGDRIHVGDDGPVLVVTLPRAPCFKFNARMGFKHAAKMMVQSGYTGWYCAVFRDGLVRAGDTLRVVAGDRVVRIDEKHRMMHSSNQDDLF